MYLIRKWNEYMGPKDERLEAEEGQATKASACILLAGCVLSLYYAIMVSQVASTTDHPVLTPLGEAVLPVQVPLTLTILAAGIIPLFMQMRKGMFSSYKRFAEIDSVPWDYVALFALFCGVVLGLLTGGMRILAEVQIVGVAGVSWLGDLAIGIVFFIMGFAVGFAAIALTIHDAIKRRRQIDRQLED